eukprot:CAMPEP_0198211598 /NCGR_PEP_ID=MMETSP1445-20131203/24711_1 /TAXON_ID=36898 /ORGANISM="Pyramimonas sp., Strain CCMP2087" /LENGTH=325 /DNA_ID=CAMNT_0043885883 /DNA_START=130 /DNA_END=1107 /DNA_ORIENTATION=+
MGDESDVANESDVAIVVAKLETQPDETQPEENPLPEENPPLGLGEDNDETLNKVGTCLCGHTHARQQRFTMNDMGRAMHSILHASVRGELTRLLDGNACDVNDASDASPFAAFAKIFNDVTIAFTNDCLHDLIACSITPTKPAHTRDAAAIRDFWIGMRRLLSVYIPEYEARPEPKGSKWTYVLTKTNPKGVLYCWLLLEKEGFSSAIPTPFLESGLMAATSPVDESRKRKKQKEDAQGGCAGKAKTEDTLSTVVTQDGRMDGPNGLFPSAENVDAKKAEAACAEAKLMYEFAKDETLDEGTRDAAKKYILAYIQQRTTALSQDV